MGEDRHSGIRRSALAAPLLLRAAVSVSHCRRALTYLVAERAGAVSTVADATWQTPETKAGEH